MLLTNNYDSLGIGTKKITKIYVRNAVHFLNKLFFRHQSDTSFSTSKSLFTVL